MKMKMMKRMKKNNKKKRTRRTRRRRRNRKRKKEDEEQEEERRKKIYINNLIIFYMQTPDNLHTPPDCPSPTILPSLRVQSVQSASQPVSQPDTCIHTHANIFLTHSSHDKKNS